MKIKFVIKARHKLDGSQKPFSVDSCASFKKAHEVMSRLRIAHTNHDFYIHAREV